MLPRTIYQSEHEQFRSSVRQFLQDQAVPHQEQWEADGIVDREIWKSAGALGMLCPTVAEELGGGGTDFLTNAVVDEEISVAGATGLGFSVHSDIVAPYITTLGTAEQQRRWLPPMCSGEAISAIAMTEPGTGSDLQSIATSAVRDGEDYIVNGSKIFISNGIHSDLIIVAAKTDASQGAAGVSLLMVERDMPGFTRGSPLRKIGLKAQDTAELFFDDVRVPAANLLGEEGKGFAYLMQNLPQERLSIAVAGIAGAETIFDITKQYCSDRQAFGRPIGKFQHNRFELAEMATEIQVTRTFIDRCLEHHIAGELDVATAAMAKWWATDVQNRVIDRCLQLHGGYGFMAEYPVAKAFVDGRVQSIYGGTNEIMKEIIGRTLGY